MTKKFELVKPSPKGSGGYQAPFISINPKDIMTISASARAILDMEEGPGNVLIARDGETGKYWIANGKGNSPAFMVNSTGTIRPDVLLPAKLRAAYGLDDSKLHRLHIRPIPVKFEGRNFFELIYKD